MEKEILNNMANQIASHSEILHRLMKRSNLQELELNLLRSQSNSKSQYAQDLFVLKQTEYKVGGFFVEFGACDGISGSNTYILENKFEWTGILAEPCRKWWSSLQKNRRSKVDFRCVYSKSNLVLDFIESKNSMLSTLATYQNTDGHSEERLNETKEQYPVVTVSLNDLLYFYDAPAEIDYISIDTEGSEYEILSAFDFTKYKVKIITVEHNWTINRQKIFELLHANGYEQVHGNATLCDDWYILK